MSADRYSFPTRQYSYRAKSGPAGLAAETEASVVLRAGRVYRFILGRDPPQELSLAEINASLHDPFARFVLGRGEMPMTLRTLLRVLDEQAKVAEDIREQRSFVVADGGQIPWSQDTRNLRREIRLLVSRGPKNHTPTLFVSTSTLFDSPTIFLQVIAWDAENGAFQFYDRREGAWIWAGSSWDALEPDSRGNGPFDSHVNGALNMKEFKLPWVHWHSQSAGIQDNVLAPGDSVPDESLWKDKDGAQDFQSIARAGVQMWTDSRFARRTQGGRLTRLPEFFRQVLDTSTVNLVASDSESAALKAGNPMTLPPTFFVNSDALFNELGLDPRVPKLTVDGGIYLECLKRYKVFLTDGSIRLPGDVHFAFVVPEAAFEDVRILHGLIAAGVLSQKLAACLLMVDFCNPIFSARRAQLLVHVPESSVVGGDDFAEFFIAAVEAAEASHTPASPESEFLDNWRLPENRWRPEFEKRIETFFTGVSRSFGSLESFAPIFELVDSRRREFRKRPLAEFKLTTPVTNIAEDAPFLEFTPAGDVRPKS